MAKMTPQDAAMLKILQQKYGASVYPNPPKATSPAQAMKQNAAKLTSAQHLGLLCRSTGADDRTAGQFGSLYSELTRPSGCSCHQNRLPPGKAQDNEYR